MTKDEERKLLEVTAGTPYQLMFAVGLYTGMRPNEYKTAIIEGEFIVANNSKRNNLAEYKAKLSVSGTGAKNVFSSPDLNKSYLLLSPL